MNFTIGKLKINIDKRTIIITIIGLIVFWIMLGHTLCSCCLFSFTEGLEVMDEAVKVIADAPKVINDTIDKTISNGIEKANMKKNKKIIENLATQNTHDTKTNIEKKKEQMKKNSNIKNASTSNFLTNTYNSLIDTFTNHSKKEGLQNNIYANSKDNGWILNPNTWSSPTLKYTTGNPSKDVQNILNRPKQPIPLPEGELDFFATTDFKPSCCPNAFSNSKGCACITTEQYKYLIERGGNNVPFSQF